MYERKRILADDERGSMLLVMFVLVLLLLVLSVLVIDLSRAQLATRGLQRSADAAALAGATELVLNENPDLTRWKDAKRAVLASIKSNAIFSKNQFSDLSLTSDQTGPSDSCEALGVYSKQIYDNGDVRVEIERGVYEGDDPPQFTSLEASIGCKAADDPTPNAVRVTLTIRNYPILFAAFAPMRSLQLDSLSRQAIGTFSY